MASRSHVFQTMNERYLIIGLGNPGREYDNTRHNVGFHCVDMLARAHHLTFDSKKSHAKIAEGTIAGQRVMLVKPHTYMNRSGSSVQGIATFYRVPPEQILVIFDDLDLPLGTLRIRQKGGSGGHRGLTDIIQRLGTREFPRIRFGIGRPPGKMDPAAYVLRRFTAEEATLVGDTTERAIQAIESWLSDGIDAAMNRYNGTAEDVAARQESQAETTRSDAPRPSSE